MEKFIRLIQKAESMKDDQHSRSGISTLGPEGGLRRGFDPLAQRTTPPVISADNFAEPVCAVPAIPIDGREKWVIHAFHGFDGRKSALAQIAGRRRTEIRSKAKQSLAAQSYFPTHERAPNTR